MSPFPPGIRRALRLPSSADRLSRDLDDEVQFHIEQRVADLVAHGMREDDARAEAIRRFGDTDDLKEYCQSIEVPHMQRVKVREWWESWMQDLRFGARQLARSPGFFAIAALTLALGIGASTSIFSVVRGVLLRPLPYPEPGRIVQLWQTAANDGDGSTQTQFSDRNFEDFRARTRSFSAMAEFTASGPVAVSGIAEPVRSRAAMVMNDFFEVVGVRPIVGRVFTPDESRQNGARAVIVSQSIWQRHLAGQADVVGQKMLIDREPFTIVGVMPAHLRLPTDAELWLPREILPRFESRTAHNFQVMARLAPGVTLEQARREASDVARQMKAEFRDGTNMADAAVIPLQEQVVGNAGDRLWILLGGSMLLLLIACANVVNLLIARMAGRQTEIALRAALGAGRRRIVQQCLAESLMLGAVAAALGIGCALAGVKLLLMLQPANLPRLEDVRVDGQVLFFAVTVAVVAAIALGIVTAWRGTSGVLRESLSQSQRTQGGSVSSERVRRGLVVVQTAMAVVLLVAAGLFGRSFLRLLSVDPGFQTASRVVVDVTGTGTRAENARLYDDLLSRFRALPVVQHAGGTNALPLAGGNTSNGTFLILRDVNETFTGWEQFQALTRIPERIGHAEYRVAGPGYFEAMGISMQRGRAFEERDDATAPHVAVISASLAETRWPKEEPIGKVIQFGNMDGNLTPFTIVGVVDDVHDRSLALAPRPTFYASYRQRGASGFSFVLSTTADPGPLMATAQRVIREVRPELAPRVRTVDAIVSTSLSDPRFVLTLVGVFGAAALNLAALGIYSVISYLVAQRGRELSIRVALGAQRGDVTRMVLRQGVLLAAAGIGVGAIASYAVTRLFASMLFEVSATDPGAFAGVVLLLALCATLASWIPARRAARAQAMDVLRG